MDKNVRLWDPANGKPVGSPLQGHTKPVTCLSWQPMHLVDLSSRCNGTSLASGCPNKLVSASKDWTIRIWDVIQGVTLVSLTSHTNLVSQVRWSGETGGEAEWGLIYSASRDTTVKVWDPQTGRMLRSLKGHAHWVNSLALNTEHVMRSGAFDLTKPHQKYDDFHDIKRVAAERYNKAIADSGGERVLTGSDDFTMFLWAPSKSAKPIGRMTGHQKLVNHVAFSPDGRFIASASFDKSIRIWSGVCGKFVSTLRGHVGNVYQLCWSADSRLLVSCSADSTVKLWDLNVKSNSFRLKEDLPGHADEVYAVDWSPDGRTVGTGSKDRILKLWEH
eukprot:GHVS01104398.1.p1 GENE.GHVS01104398.1~~GHVS01104398.1.p1  ORF type:complete len:332 (+),score=26.43 GHVS01104398.1:445-1440(+)